MSDQSLEDRLDRLASAIEQQAVALTRLSTAVAETTAAMVEHMDAGGIDECDADVTLDMPPPAFPPGPE